MKPDPGLERCLSYINCEIKPPASSEPAGPGYRAVTLSRQAGSGGHAVAERLAEILQQELNDPPCPWTVFDRNLVEHVLEDHHLPARLARFMPEDRISEMADTMDELFGLHPPSWNLVRKVSETILKLAERGNVILIGRAANVITAKMDHVFHVRLVGTIEHRINRLQKTRNLSFRVAREELRREDRGRERYVRKYFDKETADPLLYHLVINTDLMTCEDAARLIANAVSTARPALAELAA